MNLWGHRFSQNLTRLLSWPGSLLEGRAKILVIFGWHFGRNDDLYFDLNLTDLYHCYTMESKPLGSCSWIYFTFMQDKIHLSVYISSYDQLFNLHIYSCKSIYSCIYQDDKHLGANRSTYIRMSTMKPT